MYDAIIEAIRVEKGWVDINLKETTIPISGPTALVVGEAK